MRWLRQKNRDEYNFFLYPDWKLFQWMEQWSDEKHSVKAHPMEIIEAKFEYV